MFCSNCGKRIPDNSIFCPECGSPVRQSSGQLPDDSIKASSVKKRSSTKPLVVMIACMIGVLLVLPIVVFVVFGSADGESSMPDAASVDDSIWSEDPDVDEIVGVWDLNGATTTGDIELAYESESLVIKSDGSLKFTLDGDTYSGEIRRVETDDANYEYSYAVKIESSLWAGVLEEEYLVMMMVDDLDSQMIFDRS